MSMTNQKPPVSLDTLNEGQRRIASTLDEPLFVEAGAGSGKTFTLTQRIAWALCPGSGEGGAPFLEDLGQVLVITFTEAAAREIRERVRATLRRAGMAEAALSVDDAWISTIHGMCSRILHRHALDLGLDPEFGVVSGSEQESLFSAALDAAMGEARADERLREPLAQMGIGGYTEGIGYTGAMGLVKSIYDAGRALPGGLRALEAAEPGEGCDLAGLMRDLLMRVEELGAEKLTAAAAAKVGPSLEALRAFDALAPGKKDAEAASSALACVELPRASKAIAEKLADAKAAFAVATCEVAFLSAAAYAPDFIALARKVEDRYRSLKHEAGVVDNDDLVALALAAVRDNPEVRRDYAGRFRLVMVDEFQDTDEGQLALIELLAGEGARHLCTVGDAQQSIYRFRGADVDVFYRRGEGVGAEGTVRLDTNYRSHGDVLKFVERVSLGRASGLGLGGGETGTMRAFMHLDDNPGRADALRARDLPRVDVELVSGTGVSGRPTAYQSAFMAAQVADALATYAAHGERPGDMALLLGVTTHADLYIDALRARGLECVVTGGSTFTKTDEVKVMCALLHTLANPADTQSGLFPLLASEMFGIDANDLCELGTRVQEKLPAPTKRPIDRGIAGLELLPGHVPSRRLARAHEVLTRAWGQLGCRPVADVCADVVRDSGWLARLQSQGAEGTARAANVLAAVRYIRDLTQSMGLGCARAAVEFDRWLAASKIAPASLAGGDAAGAGTVRIMTIHASKGLEFPVCAVAECWGNPRGSSSFAVMPAGGGRSARLVLAPFGLEDKQSSRLKRNLSQIDAAEALDDMQDGRALPLSAAYAALRELDAQGAAEEKARLLYVAMTRAREVLILAVAAASGKEGISSALASDAVFALTGERRAPAAGIGSVDYGGRGAARLRCVCVESEGKGAEKVVRADAGGSFAAIEGELPGDPALIPALAAGEGEAAGQVGERPEGGSFELFEVEPEPAGGAVVGWRPREGVYSYSSAHAAQEGTPRGASPRERAAAEEGAPATGDPDRATNLGSAFHELAQAMVESGQAPDQAQVDAMCARWNLSERARARLSRALARWAGSSVRAEAIAHGLVRAEVPFFVERPCEHGDYFEGAIDLLCTDEGSDEALVVDYKTGDAGLSPQEVRERHAMQAEFYADVLRGLGWSRVECAFVCVEREDPDAPGEPLCARYEFGG